MIEVKGAWMTAGTSGKGKGGTDDNIKRKQGWRGRERVREKETERDAGRPVADGQAEESHQSCGLEKQAPSPCVDCPSPTVRIQRPGPVLPVHQPVCAVSHRSQQHTVSPQSIRLPPYSSVAQSSAPSQSMPWLAKMPEV